MNRRNFLKSACAAAVAGLVGTRITGAFTPHTLLEAAGLPNGFPRRFPDETPEGLLAQVNSAMWWAGTNDYYEIDRSWSAHCAILRVTAGPRHWPARPNFRPEKLIVSLPRDESAMMRCLRDILHRTKSGDASWCTEIDGVIGNWSAYVPDPPYADYDLSNG